MFKYLSLTFLCLVALGEGGVLVDTLEPGLKSAEPTSDLEQWSPHVMDFLELIDLGKLMMVGMKYISDPEVLGFAAFVTSPKFAELAHKFESMDEFKEAFSFLASKGYNVELIINFINSALNIPPFEAPKILRQSEKGISGLLQETMAALPIEDMKKLFESKLENSKEVAELFETITSDEFIKIMKKMSQNPNFKEFKMIFESYGFDFEIICTGVKEIFGDHYQGIFCE